MVVDGSYPLHEKQAVVVPVLQEYQNFSYRSKEVHSHSHWRLMQKWLEYARLMLVDTTQALAVGELDVYVDTNVVAKEVGLCLCHLASQRVFVQQLR